MKRSKNKIPKNPLKYSCKKLFWKYAANLQKNPHTEMFFNYIDKLIVLWILNRQAKISLCILKSGLYKKYTNNYTYIYIEIAE